MYIYFTTILSQQRQSTFAEIIVLPGFNLWRRYKYYKKYTTVEKTSLRKCSILPTHIASLHSNLTVGEHVSFKQLLSTKRSCRFFLIRFRLFSFQCKSEIRASVFCILNFGLVLFQVRDRATTIEGYTRQMIVPIRRNQPACDRSELTKYFQEPISLLGRIVSQVYCKSFKPTVYRVSSKA